MGEPADISATCQSPEDEDGEPQQRLRLETLVEAGDWRPFGDVEAAAEVAGNALARRLQLAGLEAAVAFSDDARVRALNRTYRGKDSPTNVLSFPAPSRPMPAGDFRHIGDIVLAVETIAREASEAGKRPADHLQHLIVHGLLHLLGYGHESKTEAARMEAIEIEVLAALGVPDPYADQV